MRMRMHVLTFLVCAAVPAAAATKQAPVIQANLTEIAVYVPPSSLSARTFMPVGNNWIEPGRAIGEALDDIGKKYFPNLYIVPTDASASYGLLVDMAPKWAAERGKVKLTITYDVYGPDGAKLHGATVEQAAQIKAADFNSAIFVAGQAAIQQVMAGVQSNVKPDPTRFPASGRIAAVDPAPLVDREKPLRTGTGTFINTAGQLVAAAHVVRECMVLEARQGESTFPLKVRATSDVLNVAVLDSGRPRTSSLVLRNDDGVVLGESITNIGYPAGGKAGDSPVLALGNISTSDGIRGSLGQFQFSSSTRLAYAGEAVVGVKGELLGMTASLIDPESLQRRGVIGQNVNFAVDARQIRRFLAREKVPYASVPAKAVAVSVNDGMLPNVVQIACYQ